MRERSLQSEDTSLAQSSQLPAVAILGPTASGKSALALELADQGLPVEIISLDSALVYRDMNIGTAKPTPLELTKAPHHLINIITPESVFNASDFVVECLRLIEDIRARKKVPLIVGGTMMYYKALTDGIDAMPERNVDIRAQIEIEARDVGWAAMHLKLAQVDPETAARLKPNDAQRIERALEVFRVSGKPISRFQKRNEQPLRTLPTLTLLPGDRAALHAQIAKRFDSMLESGLIEEVQQLRKNYALNANLPSMRCVGYRQVWAHLEGECSYSEMIDQGVAATRQLAKRQLTWLRSISGQTQIDPQCTGWQARASDWLSQHIEGLCG